MTRETEPERVSRTDKDAAARAAAAVGLEVTRERYAQTLVRVRRVRRAARLAALLGPLGGVVPGTGRRAVAVAGGDAREVLGKLYTGGVRYRRLLAGLDGDAEQVDPGGGLSDPAIADLRRRLSAAPDRVQAGDYAAVASVMADANDAIKQLLAAREADCGRLGQFDADRLRQAAREAADQMNVEYEARRAAARTAQSKQRPDVADDFVTPVGNSDQIRPEALEDENVDPEAIAALADDEEEVDPDEFMRSLGIDPDEVTEERARAAEERRLIDGVESEEVIGSSFDIDVDADEGISRMPEVKDDGERNDTASEGGAEPADSFEPADVTAPAPEERDGDGDDGGTTEDDEEFDDGGFQFGVATEAAGEDDR